MTPAPITSCSMTTHIESQIRAIAPNGVDIALEPVGTNVLPDTLRCVRVHGGACLIDAALTSQSAAWPAQLQIIGPSQTASRCVVRAFRQS